MFRPRRGVGGHRFVNWQLGLFFLAAGIWLGGLLSGRRGFTEVSLALLLVAVVLGLIGRRQPPGEDDGPDL